MDMVNRLTDMAGKPSFPRCVGPTVSLGKPHQKRRKNSVNWWPVNLYSMRTLFLSVSLFLWQRRQALHKTNPTPKKSSNTLASAYGMNGRGYVSGGDRIAAAAFIEQEMRSIGLKPLFENDSYTQGFGQDVNAFVQEPLLLVDGKNCGPQRLYHPPVQRGVGGFLYRTGGSGQ